MACIVFSLEDGTTFTTPLESELTTVGRHPESMVPLPSASVSSHHGAIRWRDDAFYVQDLGSRNGTKVNGAEIEESKLNDGDRISFGDVQAVYFNADAPPEVVAPAPVAPPQPVNIPTPTVQKLVSGAPPVSGIPPGAGRYAPKPRTVSRPQADEGGGCMTGFILMVLFVLAFALGLSLRHYKQTGGFLPNDLTEKLFNKASKIRIETGDQK
ncbi:MAG: Adenylate cyclase [Verrucomicrobiaceae bacterium]|nr:Adenylate cyclase [Verrucomicrobiaceae bacterium]